MIEDHPLFANISQGMPLSIKDFGVQRPFNDEDFSGTMLRDGGDTGYTAGINLFWCDGMFTPTPGIPVRAETIPDVMECYFKVPAAMPHSVIISLKEGERPLEKAWRVVRHQPRGGAPRDDGRHRTRHWRRLGAGSPGRVVPFQVHAAGAERLQVAMQLRENMANDHEAMSRTQLQRANAHGRGQASATHIAAEYATARMAKGRA